MTGSVRPLAVVIPTFGRHELTSALLADCAAEADLVDVTVVDGAGTFDDAPDGVEVVRPGRNLGWLLASDLGMGRAQHEDRVALMTLNNDTRLSPGFFAGILTAFADTAAGLVGPMYDDYWPHQIPAAPGPAPAYVPRRRHTRVPFVDGTCIAVDARLYAEMGGLDHRYAPWGYGADYDLGLRTHRHRRTAWVTELAYLNHVRHGTVSTLDVPDWQVEATRVQNDGLEAVWGLRLSESRPEDKDAVMATLRGRIAELWPDVDRQPATCEPG